MTLLPDLCLINFVSYDVPDLLLLTCFRIGMPTKKGHVGV